MSKIWTIEEITQSIEYTLLKPTTTRTMIENLCEEAKYYKFASVAINPYWVPLSAKILKDSEVAVCTGIGFPLGANTTEIKAAEAKLAVQQGAKEIDLVINIGKAKEGDWAAVENDIAAIVQASRPAIVKVIIEACYLTDEEKVLACKAALNCGADFVKTSTGFGTSGATIEDVKLMRATVGEAMRVKAAGGIRTLKDAIAMLDAGADRIGTSHGVAIVKEFEKQGRI